ncbi:hypothetical protein OIU84_008734 [Salix udensis]|uniref:Uncharacterized protein n=1 Tax=Salix udensis TaxID=889485 RepID=A0AAD6JRW4_9ROSI|nr:hypothetical protein OIU84_008734 [Salix udensis]
MSLATYYLVISFPSHTQQQIALQEKNARAQSAMELDHTGYSFKEDWPHSHAEHQD